MYQLQWSLAFSVGAAREPKTLFKHWQCLNSENKDPDNIRERHLSEINELIEQCNKFTHKNKWDDIEVMRAVTHLTTDWTGGGNYNF